MTTTTTTRPTRADQALADAGAGGRAARRLRRRRVLAGAASTTPSARWTCRPAAPRCWRARARWPKRASCPPCPRARKRRRPRQAGGRGQRAARGQALGRRLRGAGRRRTALSRRHRPALRAGHGGREARPLDEMERLLRRVIELKPDNAHAHNALGYSLADRSLRLPEARDLIRARSTCRRATPSSPTAWAGSSSAGQPRRGAAPAAPGLRRAARRRDRRPPGRGAVGDAASATRRAASGPKAQGPRRRQRRAARNAGPAQGRPVTGLRRRRAAWCAVALLLLVGAPRGPPPMRPCPGPAVAVGARRGHADGAASSVSADLRPARRQPPR
jgi:hypothetical protein